MNRFRVERPPAEGKRQAPSPSRGRVTNEWVEWHRGYLGNDTLLTRRLRRVKERIRDSLNRLPPGRIRVVSMCTGDGRDLLGVLADHSRRNDVRARLVDITPELVDAGRRKVARARLSGVEFVLGDAGTTSAYFGAVPADLVLACGVFGNLTDADVHNTVRHLSELCAPHATVIWTRGQFAPDLTPTVRQWFREAGFEELSFDAIPGSTASVGVHRLRSAPRRYRQGVRLFTFLPPDQRPSQRKASAAERRRSSAPLRTRGKVRSGRGTHRSGH